MKFSILTFTSNCFAELKYVLAVTNFRVMCTSAAVSMTTSHSKHSCLFFALATNLKMSETREMSGNTTNKVHIQVSITDECTVKCYKITPKKFRLLNRTSHSAAK